MVQHGSQTGFRDFTLAGQGVVTTGRWQYMARSHAPRSPGLLWTVAIALGLLIAGCSTPSAQEPAGSCDELRTVWEDAGGPIANYSVQVTTVERVTELGAEADPDERIACADLFDAAYTAANCSAPDLRPEFRSCPGT